MSYLIKITKNFYSMFLVSFSLLVFSVFIQTIYFNTVIQDSLEKSKESSLNYQILAAVIEMEQGFFAYFNGAKLNGKVMVLAASNTLKKLKNEVDEPSEKELIEDLVKNYDYFMTSIEDIDNKISIENNKEKISVLNRQRSKLIRKFMALQDKILLTKNKLSYEAAEVEGESKIRSQKYRRILDLVLLSLFSFIAWIFSIAFRANNSAKKREKYLAETIQEIKNKNTLLEEQQTLLKNQEMIINQSGKFTTLGEYASSIGHELNNAIFIIQSSVENLMDKRNSENIEKDKNFKILSRIFKTSKQLERITKGLRNFARASNNDQFQVEDLEDIITEAELFFKDKIYGKGITYDVSLEKGIKFECIRSEIIQIILNLINNAADAIENDHNKAITITTRKATDSIELRIIDSGTGISNEQLDKLSQSYFTTKEVGKGTGLGLAICKKIVFRHHGSLSIDDECKTTCFLIEIPIYQDTESELIIAS